MFLRRYKPSWQQKAKRYVTRPPGGYRRMANYFILRVKRRPGSPEYVAKGFAFGIAINYWPVLFTHWLGGFLLCRLFKGDVLAMIIGTLFGNPWTYAIIYPLCYKLGKTLMGLRPHDRALHHLQSIEDIWAQIWPITSWHSLSVGFHEILLPMILGGFLLGLPSAFVGYFLVRNAVRVFQAQRRKAMKKEQFHNAEIEIETPVQ